MNAVERDARVERRKKIMPPIVEGEKIKLKNPVVFLAAQGKCGKLYMARMLKITKGIGMSTHEWLVRGMVGGVLWGWTEPTEELLKISPYYKQFSVGSSMQRAENVWKSRSLPILYEFTEEGPFIDGESRFIVIYYYLAKKYLHPDSMKIILMRRPLDSIAYQNCRHGAYSISTRSDGSIITYTGNLIFPWGNNNLTVMEKNIKEASPMECSVWYTYEMEERKKKLHEYFPEVSIMEWDMETDSSNIQSHEKLHHWLGVTPHKNYKKLVEKNIIIHLGPDKLKEKCTIEQAREIIKEYKIVRNPKTRPEFML